MTLPVRLFAPASRFSLKGWQRALKALGRRGFLPMFRPDITERSGIWAGSVDRRREELGEVLLSKEPIAMAVRGGYGTTAILGPTDLYRVKGPKLVSGASDITALLLWLENHAPEASPLMGPMAIPDFGEKRLNEPLFERILKAFLKGEELFIPLPYTTVIQEGAPLQGRALPACLTLLSLSLGTAFEPDTRGRVLFLEDVHETPARILRLLEHLRNAKKLEGIGGVVFSPQQGLPSREILPHLRSFFFDAPFTVLYGTPFGHTFPRQYIPFGFRVHRLSSRRLALEGRFGEKR